jgi:hypothetical protein
VIHLKLIRYLPKREFVKVQGRKILQPFKNDPGWLSWSLIGFILFNHNHALEAIHVATSGIIVDGVPPCDA